jgi:MATE family multidrug resistance protein
MLTVPAWIVGVYTDDAAVIAIAVELLFLAAIFQLSDGIQVSSAGILRGLNDTRTPMLITVVAYWLVGLPLGAILGFRFGLGARGMWMGLIAGLTAAAVLLTVRYRSMSRRLPESLAS